MGTVDIATRVGHRGDCFRFDWKLGSIQCLRDRSDFSCYENGFGLIKGIYVSQCVI